jgi:hypothetical protein
MSIAAITTTAPAREAAHPLLLAGSAPCIVVADRRRALDRSATTSAVMARPSTAAGQPPTATTTGRPSAFAPRCNTPSPPPTALWPAPADVAHEHVAGSPYIRPRQTATAAHRATELDTESTTSQQTDGGDDGDDAGDESAGLSEALPTTYPGFTPLYRRVPMTRAQAYARLAELHLGELPRPHGAATTTSKQQPRPARRPPASPNADDVAHAFTPLYHCTFRKQPPPAPASDRRPL